MLAWTLVSCSDNEHWGVDQHGAPLRAEQLAGHWVIINYWAVWCEPCHREVAELNQLSHTRDDVRVLGVSFDGLRGADLQQAVETMGIHFPILLTDPADFFRWPRSTALPQSYVLDKQGHVRLRLSGWQTAREWSQRLDQLAAE